ncbi:MAG: T9SS type A sorting domain-containing protein [Bacteroidota bacterium]
MYRKYFYSSRLFACCYLILNICLFTFNLKGQNYFSKQYDPFNQQEGILNFHLVNTNEYLFNGGTRNYYFIDSTKGYLRWDNIFFFTTDSNGVLKDTLRLANTNDQAYGNTSLCNKKPYFMFYRWDTLTNSSLYFIIKVNSIHPVDTHLVKLNTPCTACIPLRAHLNSRNEFIILGRDSNTVGDALNLTVYDSNGVLLKYKTFPNIVGVDPYSVIQDTKGNYIIAGMRWQQLHDTIGGVFNIRWYGMIDSNLNMIWYNYPYQGTLVDSKFTDVIQLSDGNYLFSGNNGIGLSTVKVNQTGNIIWQKNYFIDTLSYQISFRSIYEVIEKGGFLYAIALKDTSYPGQYRSSMGFPLLLKLTLTGKLVWRRQLSFNQKNMERLIGINATSNGLLMFGQGDDTLYNQFNNNAHAWLVKTDTNGCVIPGCNLNDVIDTSNSGIQEYENLPSENDFTVYPNPTTGLLKISSKNISIDFIITDVLGKTLKTGNTKDEINVSDFVNGIYFISINQKWKKFLKE